MKLRTPLLFALALALSACGPARDASTANQPPDQTPPASSPTGSTLALSDAAAALGCEPLACRCADGQIGYRPCIEVKIYAAITPRRYDQTTGYTMPNGCVCPALLPDGGTPPDATPVPAPAPDAQIAKPDAGIPDAKAPAPEPDAAIDAPTCYPEDPAPEPDAAVPPQPDAAPQPAPDAAALDCGCGRRDAARPDAFVPTTLAIPDAAPDLRPDLGPDLMPDLGPDLGPDLRPAEPDLKPAEPDAFVALDTIPDTEISAPDSAPDLKPDLKPDTMPACYFAAPWQKDLTAKLLDCGGVELTWDASDCSKQGFKVLWRKYVEGDPSSLLPTYPDNRDGYQYLDNAHANGYTVDGLGSGTWIFRACKYKGGDVCGEYSNTVSVTIP